MKRILLGLPVLSLSASLFAGGSTTLNDGDSLIDAVTNEAAYSEIILNAGTYPITQRVVVDHQMTIRGADGTTPDKVILEGNNTCGLMQLNATGCLLTGVTMTKGKLTSDSTTYEYGAAVNVTSASVVSNCIFTANTLGGKGSVGVVVLGVANSVVTHCRFTKNSFPRDVQYGGGIGLAIRGSGKPCFVRNTLIDDNDQTVQSAQTNGGMIGGGGGSLVWVVNCTIVNNRVKAGPAAFGYYGAGAIKAVNCLVVGNTKNGTASVGSATFYNTLADVELTGTECAVTNTEIFADYANGDYRLTKLSDLAVDKGDSARNYGTKSAPVYMDVEATDLDGNARIMGEEVDIGCYEYNPDERSVTYTVTPDGGTEPVDLTFTATPNGLGDAPTYYWDFDGDGTADYVTTDATFTRTFYRGAYPVTLYASNLTANVGVSYARAEPMVINQGLSLGLPATDWWFEPFAEPLTATLTGDLGESPKFYWDWTGDGVADAVTDEPVLKRTFVAGSYPVTVIASNLTAGVGLVVAADAPMTVLVRPRVTVAASDPEVGITGADIQATIDAAERGSIVTIPKGKHKTGGVVLTVLKEIELRGETGNPEDVVISNNTSTNRLLNVDAGPHCLVHSMALQNGHGSYTADSSAAYLCAAVMVADRNGFKAIANGTRPSAGLGGCVSNVIVRNSGTSGKYSDCSSVYLKGSSAKLTHSVISNCSASAAWDNGMFHPVALAIYGGAQGENLLICGNRSTTSPYYNRAAVAVQVRGTGSVLRFSTVTGNNCSWCGGVNVYGGGHFEYCVIADNTANMSADVERRKVWSAFAFSENGRPSWNKASGYSMEPEFETEAALVSTDLTYAAAQLTNAVDVADCLNATTIYATTAQLIRNAAKLDYRLPKCSPAMDVVPKNAAIALPTSDLYGNPRPQGAGYDLGCYEGLKSGLILLVK